MKHGCPRRQQCQNMAKISKSYILTPPDPQGHGMSVKCEEPIDELTVQVWLLYHHPNFKYCTLFVSGTELRTDRRTIRLLDAPGGPFRPGAQKCFTVTDTISLATFLKVNDNTHRLGPPLGKLWCIRNVQIRKSCGIAVTLSVGIEGWKHITVFISTSLWVWKESDK